MSKTKKATKMLVLSALMTAMSVAIGFICKTYLTFGAVRVTFENLPIVMAAFAFGPVVGGCVGAASDIFSCLMSGYSVNPLITVGAAAVGIIAGIFYRYVFKRDGFLNILFCDLIAHIAASMLIKSVGLYLLGYEIAILLTRIPLYLGISLAESYLIYILYKNPRLRKELGGREV